MAGRTHQPGDAELPDDVRRGTLPFCDLVMKGGITSGLVYPKAVARIARTYRLRSIGGTSVGAIAAALAAAAEYGRQTGAGTAGFDLLAGIPKEIGGDLRQKFEPQPRTKLLFDYAMGIAARERAVGKALAGLLLGFWWFRAAGGVLLALMLFALSKSAVSGPFRGWLDAFTGNGWRLLAVVVFIALGFLAGWIGGGIAAAVWWVVRRIPGNYMGMCTGLGDGQALTNWLQARINEAAGVGDRVLTFRDLWGAERPDPSARTRPGIAFEALTSDITRGLGLGLPVGLCRFGDSTPDTGYYFRGDDLRAFFPPDVVAWLEDKASDAVSCHDDEDGLVAGERREVTYLGVPPPADLPILVAARLSMSFPLLFSAVPVYRRDDPDTRDAFRRHWLSDGGLISNFPIHKFDRPLPRWPTFAFDLINRTGPPPASLDDQVSVVSLQDTVITAAGAVRTASGAPRDEEIRMTDVLGFAHGLLNTSRGWVDNAQKTLPGYKERIVGIHLYDGEGGLNLDMDEDTIDALAERGLHGAEKLLALWKPVTSDQWNDHRWTRFRIIMRELEEIGRQWADVYDDPAFGTETIEQWVEDLPLKDPGRPYQWEVPEAARLAKAWTEAFDGFAETVSPGEGPAAALVFDQPVAPKPNPDLFMIPPFE